MLKSVTAGLDDANQTEHVENALTLFAYMSASLRIQFANDLPRIAHILNSCMQHPDLYVQACAVRATWWLVQGETMNEDDDETEEDALKPFIPLVASSLQVITRLVVQGHSKAQETIEYLIDLAGSDQAHVFNKSNLTQTITMMFELAQTRNNQTPSRLRITALELCTSLAETRSVAVRKLKPPENAFASAIIPILVQMMMEVPDLQGEALTAWGNRYPINASASSASYHADDEDDCDDDDQQGADAFEAALEYVDRVSRSMKGKRVLPVVFACAKELFANPGNWRMPHTALLMLAHVVEFSGKKDGEFLEMTTVASQYATTHPHPRVRHAALTMLARLAYDCAPMAQSKHPKQYLGVFIAGLRDACPRVQAHASTAVINYFAACEEDDFEIALKPYLHELLEALFGCLNSSTRVVQENVLTAIASVATCAGEGFIPYYEHTMPMLQLALQSIPASAVEYVLLKSRAVDCMSLIGVSVGAQVFAQQASWLVQYLVENMPLKQDDTASFQHVLAAWMRLCEVMKLDLAPHAHRFVPFVMEIAQQELDDDEDVDDDDDNAPDADADSKREQELFHARTAQIDDKLFAYEALSGFGKDLGIAFAPYLEDTLKIFLRDIQMDECSHDDLRHSAATGLAPLFNCIVGCVKQGLFSPAKLVSETMESLCIALNTEESLEVLKAVVRSLGDTLQILCESLGTLHGDLLDGPSLETVGIALMQCLRDSIQRRALSFAEKKCEQALDGENPNHHQDLDEDAEEDYQARVQDEHELHFFITFAVEWLAKACPDGFIPVLFQSASFGSHVFDLAHPIRLCHDQKVAVFLIDDALEYGTLQSMSPEFVYKCVMILINALKLEKSSSAQEPLTLLANLHQAAGYGLGQCAMRFQNNWLGGDNVCAAAAVLLKKILDETPTDLRSQEFDFGSALDNCASSLIKFVQNCGELLKRQGLNLDDFLDTWVGYLPLENDSQEATFCTETLLAMAIDLRVPFLWSSRGWSKMVLALAKAIDTPAMNEAQLDRALVLMEEVKRTVGEQAFVGVVRTLPADQLQRLARLF